MPGLTLERVDVLTDGVCIDELVTLVNAAYDAAEASLWQIPLGRTTAEEMQRWVNAGSVVVARVSGRLVGSVTSHMIDPATGWFGALAVDPSWSGRGVASALVRFAETTRLPRVPRRCSSRFWNPTRRRITRSGYAPVLRDRVPPDRTARPHRRRPGCRAARAVSDSSRGDAQDPATGVFHPPQRWMRHPIDASEPRIPWNKVTVVVTS